MTATLDTQALKKLDQAHHLHPFTDFEDYAKHGGRIVSRAEHIYIYDSDGNKIQDGMSGLWCCNLGYSQDRIKQAVAEQLAELPFYNNFFRCSNQPGGHVKTWVNRLPRQSRVANPPKTLFKPVRSMVRRSRNTRLALKWLRCRETN